MPAAPSSPKLVVPTAARGGISPTNRHARSPRAPPAVATSPSGRTNVHTSTASLNGNQGRFRRSSVEILPAGAAAYYATAPREQLLQKKSQFIEQATEQRRVEYLKQQEQLAKKQQEIERRRLKKEAEKEEEARRQAAKLKFLQDTANDSINEKAENIKASERIIEARRRSVMEISQKMEGLKMENLVKGAVGKQMQKLLQDSIEQIDQEIERIKGEISQCQEWLKKPKDKYMSENHTIPHKEWIVQVKHRMLASHKRLIEQQEKKKEAQRMLESAEDESLNATNYLEKHKAEQEQLLREMEEFQRMQVRPSV